MNQETIKRPNNSLNHISFQQKSAGVSLVITSSAALYFSAGVWPMRPAAVAGGAIPAGYGGVIVVTLVLIVVAQIVLQSVLAIGQGAVEPANSAEQTAALKARRNAHFVLTIGAIAAVGSVFVAAPTIFDTANIVVLGLALAEIVHAASQLFYVRR
jgi:hypothetical protein